MKKLLITAIMATIFSAGTASASTFQLYDDFSENPNTKWTTSATAPYIDLNASRGTVWPYTTISASDGNVALMIGDSSDGTLMSTDTELASEYKITFDYYAVYGNSSSWSNNLYVGTENDYVRLEFFPNSAKGTFAVYSIIDGTSTKQLTSTTSANGRYHYEILIDNGDVTVTRWARDYTFDTNPNGYDSLEYVDQTTFAYNNFSESGNMIWFNTLSGTDTQGQLDNVYKGTVPEPATMALLACGSLVLLRRRK